MTENGQPHKRVPKLPWEIVLNQSGFDFEPADDGGMVLAFFPTAATPTGVALMPPALKVAFDKDGWREFSERVASGGEARPRVPIARVMPPPPKP